MYFCFSFFSARQPAMMGPMGLFWQSALVLDIIIYIMYASLGK